MSDIDIDVSGVAKLASKLNGSAGVIEAELKTAVHRSGLQVQATGQRTVKVWRGDLRRAHTTRSSGLTATVSVNRPHARPIHDGRAAGARMPPPNALVGWRGVTAKNAFVVARAIGRKGIKGDKWLEKALEASRSFIEAEITQAATRALRRMGL